MVWTPEQTGLFLDRIQHDRLYPLIQLIAYRGLRRGEACGVRWVDLSKSANSLTISEQLVQVGWVVEAGEPKSDAGGRIIALDKVTLAVLEAWRKHQIAERLAWGGGWIQSGRIFTREDGGELHSADVTKHFNALVAAALPPVRLHDLPAWRRHRGPRARSCIRCIIPGKREDGAVSPDHSRGRRAGPARPPPRPGCASVMNRHLLLNERQQPHDGDGCC
jgi:integrase